MSKGLAGGRFNQHSEAVNRSGKLRGGLLAVIFCAAFWGCSKKSVITNAVPPIPTASRKEETYPEGMIAPMTRKQLGEKIHTGATSEEIAQIFGFPLNENKAPDATRWTYIFPPLRFAEVREDDTGGMVIIFVEGKVFRWDPILSGTPKRP
jgi:hypothetical protein